MELMSRLDSGWKYSRINWSIRCHCLRMRISGTLRISEKLNFMNILINFIIVIYLCIYFNANSF